MTARTRATVLLDGERRMLASVPEAFEGIEAGPHDLPPPLALDLAAEERGDQVEGVRG